MKAKNVDNVNAKFDEATQKVVALFLKIVRTIDLDYPDVDID